MIFLWDPVSVYEGLDFDAARKKETGFHLPLFIESYNHRITKVRRDLQDQLVQPSSYYKCHPLNSVPVQCISWKIALNILYTGDVSGIISIFSQDVTCLDGDASVFTGS